MMTTRWCLWIFAGLVLIGRPLESARAQAAESIAFVNMETVFSEYYKTKRADQRLKEKAEEFGEEREDMIEQLRKLEEEFEAAREEAQDQTLSQSARDERREAAEEKLADLKVKEREIRAYEDERRSQLEQQGKRMRQRIVDEITAEIGALARERNLLFVMDSSGETKNNIPFLLYAESRYEITEDIIARINENAVAFGDEAEEGEEATSSE